MPNSLNGRRRAFADIHPSSINRGSDDRSAVRTPLGKEHLYQAGATALVCATMIISIVFAEMEAIEFDAFRTLAPYGFRLISSMLFGCCGAVFTFGAIRIYRRRRLAAFARHRDIVTMLPNRAGMQEHLELSFRHAESGFMAALLLIHVSRLPPDGHDDDPELYNELASIVGARLRANTRKGDVVARVGNADFAILQRLILSRSNCEALAERLIELVGMPIQHQGQTVHLAATIGCTVLPTEATSPEAAWIAATADLGEVALKKRPATDESSAIDARSNQQAAE